MMRTVENIKEEVSTCRAATSSAEVNNAARKVEAGLYENPDLVDTLAPTEAPAPVEAPPKPNVWEMPNEGLQWCDCGEGCEIDQLFIEDQFWMILDFDDEPEWITHPELCQVIQKLWNYESVCNFFFDHVALSAKAVYGKLAEKYPYPVAVEIVGYFSKTWNGCPEEACEGGYDWSDM